MAGNSLLIERSRIDFSAVENFADSKIRAETSLMRLPTWNVQLSAERRHQVQVCKKRRFPLPLNCASLTVARRLLAISGQLWPDARPGLPSGT